MLLLVALDEKLLLLVREPASETSELLLFALSPEDILLFDFLLLYDALAFLALDSTVLLSEIPGMSSSLSSFGITSNLIFLVDMEGACWADLLVEGLDRLLFLGGASVSGRAEQCGARDSEGSSSDTSGSSFTFTFEVNFLRVPAGMLTSSCSSGCVVAWTLWERRCCTGALEEPFLPPRVLDVPAPWVFSLNTLSMGSEEGRTFLDLKFILSGEYLAGLRRILLEWLLSSSEKSSSGSSLIGILGNTRASTSSFSCLIVIEVVICIGPSSLGTSTFIFITGGLVDGLPLLLLVVGGMILVSVIAAMDG